MQNIDTTCNLSICFSICNKNYTYTKDTVKENLKACDFFLLPCDYTLKILDIHTNFVTCSVENEDICVIRNYMLDAEVPLCLKTSCYTNKILLKVTKINSGTT